MFKNSVFFQLSALHGIDPAALQDALAAHPATSIGAHEVRREGWVSPFSEGHESLVHSYSGAHRIRLQVETKKVPKSTLDRRVAAELRERDEQPEKVARSLLKRVRESAYLNLLAKALPQVETIDMVIDLEQLFIAVEASSSKKAEAACTALRQALGSLPVTLPSAQDRIRTSLTRWLREAQIPEGLAMGAEAELRCRDDEGIARLTRHDLHSEEITAHLDAGKICTRLAMAYPDDLSFVVDDHCVLRKLRLPHVDIDEGDDSPAAVLEARMVLLVDALRRLHAFLNQHFRAPEFEVSLHPGVAPPRQQDLGPLLPADPPLHLRKAG